MVAALHSKIPARLLSSIQQAANDPQTWHEALARITDWVGGDVGSLLARRQQPEPETVLVACGIEPENHPAHPRHHGRRAPYPVQAARLPVGRAVLLRHLLHDNRSYRNELCRAQNLTDLQGVVLFRDAYWRVSLNTFSRGRRRFNEQTRARLEAIGHHVHGALLHGRRYEAVGSEASLGLKLARDMGLVKTLIVDARLRVLEGHDRWQPEPTRSRSSSQRAGKNSNPLRIEQRLLRATEAQDQVRLAQAVEHALRGKSTLLTFQTGNEATLVGMVPGPWLSPLSAERTASLILPPSSVRATRVEVDRMQSLPAALRQVAEHLALGCTDKEIAVSMGLSLASARTYVARVMKRLSVNNRRELMRRSRSY